VAAVLLQSRPRAGIGQIAPDVTRVAVLRYATTPSGVGQFGMIQSVAQSLRLEHAGCARDAGRSRVRFKIE